MRAGRITAAAAAGVGILIAFGGAPRPGAAQALSGFDVFRANCGGCHELYDPEAPRRTRAQWDQILTRMVKVRGATLNRQEYAAVLNYLDSFNREKREIRWVEGAARSRRAALNGAEAGRLPEEWVDLTLGADSEIPWAIQVDPATRAAYLQPLKSAGEGQFPALIDNTGLVQDGGASVRAQIVSGKAPLGAGLIFGFRNPQSYFGVRLGPRDVVLYEVQGGQRALLSRSPATTALRQWHTLAVDVTGKQVKVNLNGRALSGMSRALPNYRGGRLGICTQGDTVALFDQWELTAR